MDDHDWDYCPQHGVPKGHCRGWKHVHHTRIEWPELLAIFIALCMVGVILFAMRPR